MLGSLCSFLHLLSHCPVWLNDHQSATASAFGLRFLRVYKKLGVDALAAGVFRWRQRPKTHYVHHTVLEVQRYKLNCLFVTCFLDEDFMGKVKALASRTHRRQVSKRTMQRYIVLLAQRWHARKLALEGRCIS